MRKRGLIASAWHRLVDVFAADPALDDRWWSPLEGRVSHAGVVITAETSKQVSTVFRCVSLLSNALATLPFGVFERLDRGRREVLGHPAYRAFAIKSNPYQTPLVFKRMMMGHLVLRGNCYARIIRSSRGFDLWPLHPSRIQGPELLESGRMRYRYLRPDNGREEIYIGGQDIWHLMGLSEDGLRGLALAELAKDSFGLALAAEQHGAKLYGKGIRLAGALKTAGTMGLEAQRALARSFREEHADFGLPVLEEGLTFEKMGMTNEDAQFLESRKFSVSDIARWFGIPPHMVGDVERSTSWGTGIENQTIQFVTDGLLPWVQLWEESIDDVFIPEPEFYSRFNINERMRADSKTRFEIYQIGIANGIYSPNDCRAFEDENPREGGDVYVTPRSPNEPAPRDGAEPAPAGSPPGGGDGEEDGDAERLSQTIKMLAQSSAALLLTEEETALAKLAKEHAKDKGAWRAAVASFYGRWPGRVTEALFCTQERARVYSESRRDVVLSGGLKACDDSKDEAVKLLVALTMAAAAGGDNAAA